MAFEVCEKKCDQCLFTDKRIVSKKRFAELVKQCREQDIHFVCHKGSINGNDDLCCRGFYDTQTSKLIRMAQHFNQVKFVPVPEMNKEPA